MIFNGVSDNYAQLLEKVHWSRKHGRDVFHLKQEDVDLARLFAYGFRSQTIGAFHATGEAVNAVSETLADADARQYLARASVSLQQLADEAITIVPRDFRAALSTLYRYDQWTSGALDSIQSAIVGRRSPELESIRNLFIERLSAVAGSNGLYVANDTHLPEQGVFQVPNLGIAIVPLIYGDFHSWNFAFLPSNQLGVPVHRHRAGAEIHLGLSPVDGSTILGGSEARVREGYAMPIPPATYHGFVNKSGQDHVLPFVFGSLALSGWGIFFDVEPRQDAHSDLNARELETDEMNCSVWLDRALNRIEKNTRNSREIILSAERTSTPETGGLELSAERICAEGAELATDHFRIVSVVRGLAKIRAGSADAEVKERYYFGIPANMPATIAQVGDSPLVTLNAVILPHTVDRKAVIS